MDYRQYKKTKSLEQAIIKRSQRKQVIYTIYAAVMPLKRFESHKNNKSLSMETVACPSESHGIPINLYIFTCKFSLQEVIGLV